MNPRRIALGFTAMLLSFVAGIALTAGVTAAPAVEITIGASALGVLLLFGSTACFLAHELGEWEHG